MEIGETDTALETSCNFADIVFEATKRRDRTLPDDRSFSKEAHLGTTRDLAIGDIATSDGANFGNTEDLANLGFTSNDFLELRLEHAKHGLFNIFEDLVDNFVSADFDMLGVGQLASLTIGSDVEADDRGV